MLLLLSLLNFILAARDAWVTQDRIHKFGPKIELNLGIRYLATKWGPKIAAYAGCILPAAAQSLLCVMYDQPGLLGVFTGMRLKLFWNQLQSRKFEQELLAVKKAIDSQNSLTGGATIPQSPCGDPQPSQPPVKKSVEEKIKERFFS